MAQQENDDDFLTLIAEDEPSHDHEGVRHWRILIVDDDDDVHQATEFALTNTPILDRPLMFLHAYSSVEAIDLLKREHDIAVILLDVVMPDRNGYQVCRDLKGNAEFNRIPVIIVSSKSQESDKFWAEQQGADGYVIKPFTAAQLLDAVKKFV